MEKKKSIEIIPIDLPRHHHHPQQKHRSHDQQRERRLPIVAYALRFQPRQRRRARAVARSVGVTVAVHTALRPVQLYGSLNQARKPKHEEDKGAEHDDAGEELALGDEHEDDEEEEEGEDAGSDHVGEYPVFGSLVSLGFFLSSSFAFCFCGGMEERADTRSRKRTRARLVASLPARA